MAYHEDASVSNNYNAASGSFAYTVNANNERLFLARFSIASGTVIATAVTYNGVALTFIGRVTDGARAIEKWGLKNPASGSNTFAWTLSASAKHVAAATGMSGINQTTSYRNFTGATGNSTAPSVTVAGTTVEHKVMDVLAAQENVTGTLVVTVGPGQTQQYQNRTTGAPLAGNVVGAGSVETGGAVSTTMSWTLSSARAWVVAALEILPVVEGEIDLTGISLIAINGSAIFSGNMAFAGVGTMTCKGGRVRLGAMSFTGIAAMTCFPEFPEADVNLPVAIPQQFFFISSEPEFLLRWVLQELNRPKRVDLGKFLSVTLRVNGFPDKACVIEDANDGVAYYITSPAEFPVGRYTAHLRLVLDGNFDSSQPEVDDDQVYEVEVDTPEFIIWVQPPAA